LLDNLRTTGSSSSSSSSTALHTSSCGHADEADLDDIPEEVEEIMEQLLDGLKDKVPHISARQMDTDSLK